MFKRKKKEPGIFDDLPVAPSVEPVTREQKKTGRRAMLIPDAPFDANPSADRLIANTGKQRETWLEIIYSSQQREAKQLAIATFLQDNYRVQKWWANSISLMYLDWRATAKSGAKSNSLRLVFEVPTNLSSTYTLLNSASIYGKEFRRVLKSVQDQRIVLTFEDETRATLVLETRREGSLVIVEHEFIKDSQSRKITTKYWNELFTKLIAQVSR